MNIRVLSGAAAAMICVAFAAGCASSRAVYEATPADPFGAEVPVLYDAGESSAARWDAGEPRALRAGAAAERTGRMLAVSGSVRVEVRNVDDAVRRTGELVQRHGGYVESTSDDGAASASLTLRVPSAAVDAVADALAAMGEVTRRRIEGRDVTEQYVDLEARLANKIALRDRLKELLGRAEAVKDVLSIETELNRIQSDIDSMEGRMRVLKERVELATLQVDFSRRPVPGPLGYVFKGLWWGIEKLFVIRGGG